MQFVNTLLRPPLSLTMAQTQKKASPASQGRRGHTHHAWSAAAEGTLPYKMSKALWLAPAILALDAKLLADVVELFRQLLLSLGLLASDLVALHQRHVERFAGGR